MPTGWFPSQLPYVGHPFIRGLVALPRLGLSAEVNFLVDTGCSLTTLHPGDAGRLGIDYAALSLGNPMSGVGGRETSYTESAVLSFLHGAQIVTYRIPIDIAPALAHNDWFPSLLGMDVIRHLRMLCDATAGELSFDVHRADTVHGLDTP